MPYSVPPRSHRQVTVAATSLAILVGLTAVVLNDWSHAADQDVITSIQSQHTPTMRLVVDEFTALGGQAVLIAVVVGMSGLLLAARRWRCVAFFFGTVVAGQLLTLILKTSIDRTRPNEIATLLDGSQPSFPSGHASMSTVVYGCVLMLVLSRMHDRQTRVFMWCFTGLLVVLIGLSRVVLTVHFPTDVLAGWATGMFCVSVGAWLVGSDSGSESNDSLNR